MGYIPSSLHEAPVFSRCAHCLKMETLKERAVVIGMMVIILVVLFPKIVTLLHIIIGPLFP